MKYVCVSKVNDIMQIFRFIENIFISEEVYTWFSLYPAVMKKTTGRPAGVNSLE